MATLYTHQSKNITKTWFLMGAFLALVAAIGYYASYYYDNPGIFYFAIIFSVVMNITSYWFSDKIALKMSGAVPVDPNHSNDPSRDRELLRIVENLSITAGLPAPRTYIVNDPAPNAFATGRNKEHAAIAVTTGLLATLNRSELEGVIAHELSHIGNRDTLVATVVVILVGLISILSDMFLRMSLFGGGRSNDDNNGKAGGILAIIGLALILLSPLIATLLQLAISRRREFLADASGALLTRYPEGLASALEKISSYSAPMKRASNATAHMYISNPFGAKALQGMHKLFMTHPPAEERIKILRGMGEK
jgi:heat shock protein HtpX